MALPARQQVLIWSIAAAVFFVILWFLGDVLLPFLIAGAIAYLLDPLADRLEARGLSRGAATAIITAGFLLVAGLALLIVIPAMIRQLVDLFQIAPELTARLREVIETRFPDLGARLNEWHSAVPGLGETIRDRGAALVQGVIGSALGIVNILVLIFIVPVVTVYLLLDWDKMLAEIDSLVPRDHAPTVRQLADEMNATLSGFLRGQGTVCLVQGTFYAVALMLAGLNFGLIVGAFAGLISFIPFVGALVGGALAIGLALFQFWGDWLQIALIAGIFVFGQVVEGNVLTPRLVGASVGLHPVWLLLALSVFGALFGFAGMLVAVPLSAMIGVLVRFGVREYRSGRLYLGLEALARGDATARDRDAGE